MRELWIILLGLLFANAAMGQEGIIVQSDEHYLWPPIGPAHTREYWEQKIRRIQVGMSEGVVRQILPYQGEFSNGYGTGVILDQKWTAHWPSRSNIVIGPVELRQSNRGSSGKAYPKSDALGKGLEPVVPPELKSGEASENDAMSWASSQLSHLRNESNLEYQLHDLNGDGKQEWFICNADNAGSGGNTHLVFDRVGKGFRYMGKLSFAVLRELPPDANHRARLLTTWKGGSGDVKVNLVVQGSNDFETVRP